MPELQYGCNARAVSFSIAEAQREPVIEPHGVADDLGWTAETWVAEG